jgi:CheY-like chemotaxis protein
MRFVVVDDHPTIREVVRAMLKKLGHTNVVLAADGTDAWPLIRLTGPCVVISDIDMPRRNGLELLRDVRMGVDDVDRSTPFLLLTGHAEHELVGVALALDVSAFLVKPVSAPGLERRLARALDSKLTPKAAGHYERIAVPTFDVGPLSSLGGGSPPAATPPLPPNLPPNLPIAPIMPANPKTKTVPVAEVAEGMVLASAVTAKSGSQVLSAGTTVSPWLMGQLRDLLEMGAIHDGVTVEAR